MRIALRRALGLLVFGAVLAPASAFDVVNGWSPPGTIIKIYSVTTHTYFKMSSTPNGCGQPEFWGLSTQDTAANKAKLAMLIAAYTTGKTVSIRCENSLVTDLEITG